MQEDTGRTAFTFAPILRHRTTDAARRITAISLDTAAGRIFIGLASGHVEEYQIIYKQSHLDATWGGFGPSSTGQLAPSTLASTRLVAEKRVSRKAVLSLACLPTAARLAILCEDGTAAVASYDTWVVTALQGVRTATAMAADTAPAAAAATARRQQDIATNTAIGAGSICAKPKGAAAAAAAAAATPPSPKPVRLAIAVKSISTVAKLLVYSVAPSVGGFAASQPAVQLLAQVAVQEPITGLTWVGSGLFVQHASSYNLLLPGGRVTQIAEHGCTQPRMASAPWPSGPAEPAAAAGGSAAATAAAAAARGVLLFQDSLVLLTDGTGAAVVGSEPIAVSEPPLTLCSSGPFLVLISDADQGVLVYDRASSKLVQRIFWSHDDPWVAAGRCLPVAEDAGGSGGVAVATSSVVMLLQPVAADMQARELLKRKRFDAALALIRGCRRGGEEWADSALAQAGLLLLQELRCEDALAALEQAGAATFQPAQLLPLFPGLARRWPPERLPPQRAYWGLHGSLQSLERICEDFLELRNSTCSSPRPSPSPPASVRGGAPPSPPPRAPPPPPPQAAEGWEQHHHHHHAPHHLHSRQHQPHSNQHQHEYQHQQPQQQQHVGLAAAAAAAAEARGAAGGVRGSSPPASAAGGGGSSEVAVLAADAKRDIVAYLLRTRGSPGVTCLDVVDGLIVQLLLDTAQTALLEAFLSSSVTAGTTGTSAVATTTTAAVSTGGAGAVAPGAAGAAAGPLAAGAGAGAGPAALTGPPAQVTPRDSALVAALEAAGRYHALALLRAARGQVPPALELWQRLALGEVREAPSTSGAVADAAAAMAATGPAATTPSGDTPATTALSPPLAAALAATSGSLELLQPLPAPSQQLQQLQAPADAVMWSNGGWAAATAALAAASAAALMSQPHRTPPLLCLSKLPWLLQAAPDWALHVMRSRPLPVADVLSLLQGRSDGVRWQYLHHLVYDSNGAAATAVTSSSAVSVSGSAGHDASTALGRLGGGEDEGEEQGAGGGSGLVEGLARAASWHLDPSLHTELALELLECIGVLQARATQQQQGHGQQERQEQGGAESDAGAAVSTTAAEGTTSVMDVWELPPPLPVAVRQGSGADAVRVASGSLHQQPPSTNRQPRLMSDSHPHNHNHHSQPVLPARPSPPPPQGPGRGHAARPASGGAGSGAAAAAADTSAGAGGAASGVPSTSDLAWLGTVGVLPAAAVTRLLRLAVRAALAAAGQDPDAAGGDGGGCAGSLPLLRALSRRGDGAGTGSVAGLRAVLQHHLYFSQLYDASIVLQATRSCPSSPCLAREAVQLHCRLADHAAALALLARQLGDVEAAICYCRARCGQEGWLALLDLLLRPGGGREPDYSAACRVLAAEGAALAPLQLLEALGDSMPLHLAHSTLSRMVGSLLHRKRQGQVLRALHRAQNLALRAELAQLQAARVVVSEETSCRGCQRPLGTQVFYRYPSGVVLCARCARPDTTTAASE